jgi:hypothetical protein
MVLQLWLRAEVESGRYLSERKLCECFFFYRVYGDVAALMAEGTALQ